MKTIAYTPELFDEVLAASPDIPAGSSLRHRSFVDYYFGSSEHCKLSVVVDGQNRLMALQGVEWLPVEDRGRQLRIGCGSAFHSFRPGLGAYLLASWLRSCDAGLAFGATEPVHELLRRLKWTLHADIRTYCLNAVYRETSNHPLRRLAKAAMNHLSRRRPLVGLCAPLRGCPAEVTVHEEAEYREDLVAFKSGFGFRLAPDVAYLRWRYGLRLPFVRYRLFRVVRDGASAGYVILQDGPTGVLVSHADGGDPAVLAVAILRAVAAVAQGPADRRQVTLLSAHPVMQQMFESAGFQHHPRRRKVFAMGTLKGTFPICTPAAEWLVNADWGDRGLRRPFLDEDPRVQGCQAG